MGDPRERPVWVGAARGRRPADAPCHLRPGGRHRRSAWSSELPADLPLGIHELEPLDGGPTTTLLAGPGRCHLPDGLREWGVTVQVPTARSSRSWGIGDLADVRAIGDWIAASRRPGALALSPLHAPTPVPPIAASPYYPSSRRWRSPLLIRVDEVGVPDRPRPQAWRTERASAAGRPDGATATSAGRRQRAALEHLWARPRRPQRERTPTAGDERTATSSSAGRRSARWPRCTGPSWRHVARPRSATRARRPSARRAERPRDRVAFHAWLQQLVEEQLARRRSPGVRLVQDLAVGVDPGGADAWTWQDLLAPGSASARRPTSSSPRASRGGCHRGSRGGCATRATGRSPRSSARRWSRGGGLRIDHVMGLTRLFWVPEGGDPADGAYVRFAGHELLEVVALESARARGHRRRRGPGHRRGRASGRSSAAGGSCPPRSCGSRTAPPEAVATRSRSRW